MPDVYDIVREKFAYCQVCGSTDLLEAHHLVPRSQGGPDTEENLVLLCRSCHRKRHEELLKLQREGNELVIYDVETGQAQRKPIVPHRALGPSRLLDQAHAIRSWLELVSFGEVLAAEPDEVLSSLYDALRDMKHRLWMAQAAIIAEMQRRASRGDAVAEHVAKALGCSPRTVQVRGRIYREVLSKPESALAVETLREESWYREAVSSDEPVKWIVHAAQRKIENPRYSIAQFREEMRTGGQESTLWKVVLLCEEPNEADERLAAKLELKLGVPVEIRRQTKTLPDTRNDLQDSLAHQPVLSLTDVRRLS
jgi:hypothetical protein